MSAPFKQPSSDPVGKLTSQLSQLNIESQSQLTHTINGKVYENSDDLFKDLKLKVAISSIK